MQEVGHDIGIISCIFQFIQRTGYIVAERTLALSAMLLLVSTFTSTIVKQSFGSIALFQSIGDQPGMIGIHQDQDRFSGSNYQRWFVFGL